MESNTIFNVSKCNAEEAMNFYIHPFIEGDSEITSIVRYGANETGQEGTVMQSTFTLKGKNLCVLTVI